MSSISKYFKAFILLIVRVVRWAINYVGPGAELIKLIPILLMVIFIIYPLWSYPLWIWFALWLGPWSIIAFILWLIQWPLIFLLITYIDRILSKEKPIRE